MRRAFWFLLKLAVAVGLVVWVAEHPGTVHVTWQGYVIETSVGILALGALALAVVAAVLYRLWHGARRVPRHLRQRRHAAKRERGYRALTQGMVAVAAGNADAARRFARKADALLNEPPLTMLLSAQAAQLNGDEDAARRYFTAMLERPEMAFLGTRGLVTQALRRDDRAEALKLARRAHDLQPRTPWVLTTLFDLEARAGHWDEAEAALNEAIKAGVVASEVGRRSRAVLWLERSAAAEAERRTDEAATWADKAHRLLPGLPAAARAAALLARSGRVRRPTRIIERAWRAEPHPDLAEVWGALAPADQPLVRVKHFEKLAAILPDHPEGHLALGRAAMDAALWGEARRHLMQVLDRTESPRALRLLADLEVAQHGDAEAARGWLARAAAAPPEAAWTCAACGAVADAWHGRCRQCGTFDSLAWRTPAVAPHLEIHAPAAAAIEDKTSVAPAGALPERGLS